MDARTIEARGIEPLRDLQGRIDAVRGAADVEPVIALLHAHGVHALFDSYVEPDNRDVRRVTLTLDRARLGLPSRDDYWSTEPASVSLRAKYRRALVRVLGALGSRDAAAEADGVIAFERALAERALSRVEERDPNATDHPTSARDLDARWPATGWTAYLRDIGAARVDAVNVATPGWLAAVDGVLAAGNMDMLRAYLRVRVAWAYASVLPAAIDDAVHDFALGAVRGIHTKPPRWKRCLSLVDRDVGDDVGREFLARHFSPRAREEASAMIDAVRAAFRADLESLDWLGDDARRAALAKLAHVLAVVGGSNRMRSYEALVVRPEDAFGNAWRAGAAEQAREMAQLGVATDRERFFDVGAQEFDGFSAPHFVAIGFTAGLLQPPVFDPSMDPAVNYGAIGGVIGHELSHGFDDQGRKFDVDGNLHPWWSSDDVARFEERARCFVDEYARFHAEDGSPVDGRLTLGENIADNGGLRLSYAALRPSDAGPRVDGLTPAQRFFVAWGQIRCENVRPEEARRQTLTDGHSPGRWRVNGVVSNMPEFARAFACRDGAPMAPAQRCRVW